MRTGTPAAASAEGLRHGGRAGLSPRVELLAGPGYLIAAAALLVWGAWKRFHLPQAPIIDPDIEGYLGPAIRALAGKPFSHMMGRSFPYPGFVYLVLRIFGDFRAIAVVQHLLGIAAGGIALLAWNAAGALVPPGGISRPWFRWIGLVPACVVLGSATEIVFEHQIRPEAIFPFLAILNIWTSFLFLDARFVRRRPSFLWLGALNVFISYLIYLDKPSFGFATLFCTLPVWLSLALPGCSILEKAGLAAGAILPAVLLLYLPEHILKSGDRGADSFLPETLLTVHAAMVERQMTEDLAGNGPLPYPRPLIQMAHDLLGVELAKAAHLTTGKTYRSLGYNPDYLMYRRDSFCATFPKEAHLVGNELADFCMTYYLRALRHHPGAMAAKTLRQLAIFYTFKNPVYWAGDRMDLSGDEYGRVDTLMVNTSRLGPGNPAAARYVATCGQLAAEGIAIRQSLPFVVLLRVLSVTYLPLFAGALLSVRLLFLPRYRPHFAWLVAAVCLAYAYNMGNCLTIAIVHSLEVTRYVHAQLIFSVFAQCLSLYLLMELAVFRRRGGGTGPAAAPPTP